jgi:hypothetical protein
MTTQSERRALDEDVTFFGPADPPLNARALGLELVSEAGRVGRVRLTLRVSPETYLRIDGEALFNLHPDVRGENHLPGGFDPAQPLLIEAELRPDALLRAAPQVRTARAFWQALSAPRPVRTHPLLATEVWYACSVTQAAPPSAASEEEAAGSPPRGYRTLWAEIGAPKPGQRFEEQPLSVALASWFHAQGWPVQRGANPLLVVTTYRGTHHHWEVQARAFEDLRIVVFSSICPLKVPPDRLAVAAELCCRANCHMLVGNLELDWDSGELRLRTSLDLENDRLSPSLLNQLVAANLLQLDRLMPALTSVIQGDSRPAEALAVIAWRRT